MLSRESVLSLISKGSVTEECCDGSLCSGLLITSTVLSVSFSSAMFLDDFLLRSPPMGDPSLLWVLVSPWTEDAPDFKNGTLSIPV